MEAVYVPAHLVPPGSPQAKQLHHLHTQLSLRQSCRRQKMSCVYAHRLASVVSDSLGPCGLWPARLLCQGGGFSRQEYWSILANTGCHTVLEHFISCFCSRQTPLSTWCCQKPCDPSSCTTSVPGLTGANPSPPGQPQEQTPVDNPHAEVEIKPQLKPRGNVARKKTQNLPTSCTSC